MSLAKIHLLDSDTPLREGEDRTAICGKEVKRAVWAFMWDDLSVGEGLDFDGRAGFGVCRKCKELVIERRYVYGLIPGEERSHD